MFRIGWNNEEKEMISRTISELQELRTELSFLKDTLVKIVPEDRKPGAGGPDEKVPGYEAADGELEKTAYEPLEPETGCLQDDLDNGEMLNFEDFEVEPEETGSGNDIPFTVCTDDADNDNIELPDGREDVCEGGDEKLSAGHEDAGEAGPVEKISGPVYRDWAVVRYKSKKKPWWKIWKSDDRVINRSI